MLQLDAVKLDMPEIRKTLGEVGDSLDLAGMKTRLDELNEKIQEADFWNDQKTAQKVLKEKKHIEDEMGAYERRKRKMNRFSRRSKRQRKHWKKTSRHSASARCFPANTMTTMPSCPSTAAAAATTRRTGRRCSTACTPAGRPRKATK